jgi:predicted RNase H-like nuclease (RuvC/YqgF family)
MEQLMSLKEKFMIYLMRIGLKAMQNPGIMNWAIKSVEKKKQRRLNREEKIGQFARSWKIATGDEIISTNHVLRDLKYTVKELSKKADMLQKELEELKQRINK